MKLYAENQKLNLDEYVERFFKECLGTMEEEQKWLRISNVFEKDMRELLIT